MQIENQYDVINEKLNYLKVAADKTEFYISVLKESKDKIKSSEFLFIEEVVILLNMPVSTIRHHIAKHKLPCFAATKPIRFRKNDVLHWFEEYNSMPNKFRDKPTDILKLRRNK